MYWEPFDNETTLTDLRPYMEPQTERLPKVDLTTEPNYTVLIAVAAVILLVSGLLMIILAIQLKAAHR